MIERSTVLILGAGASKPYGFPLGRELLFKIRTELDPAVPSPLREKLLKQYIDPYHIGDFHRELTYADTLSVDAFLELRQEFLEVGKLAMTFSLIECEEEKTTLFDKRLDEPHWYQYLLEELVTPSIDDLTENKLSIITFNYDRSIDHYLFKAIQSRYKKSDEECARILDKIPIIHVHGRLGALPWQAESGRPYSSMCNQNVKKVSEQIKVITEDIYPSPDFEKALHLMNKAVKIMFLGFGYHEANLRRLQVNEFKNKVFVGTSYGLARTRRRNISSKWKIRFPGYPCKILKLLQEHVTMG